MPRAPRSAVLTRQINEAKRQLPPAEQTFKQVAIVPLFDGECPIERRQFAWFRKRMIRGPWRQEPRWFLEYINQPPSPTWRESFASWRIYLGLG